MRTFVNQYEPPIMLLLLSASWHLFLLVLSAFSNFRLSLLLYLSYLYYIV